MLKLLTISVIVLGLTQVCTADDVKNSEPSVTPEMALKVFESKLLEAHEYEGYVDFENLHYYESILLRTIDGEPAVYYMQAYWGPEPAPTYEELEERLAIVLDMAYNRTKYIDKGMTKEEIDKEIRRLSYINEDRSRYTSYALIGASIDRPLSFAHINYGFPLARGKKSSLVPAAEKENPGYKFSGYISIFNGLMTYEFKNDEGESIYDSPRADNGELSLADDLLRFTDKKRAYFKDNKEKFNEQWKTVKDAIDLHKKNGNGMR